VFTSRRGSNRKGPGLRPGPSGSLRRGRLLLGAGAAAAAAATLFLGGALAGSPVQRADQERTSAADAEPPTTAVAASDSATYTARLEQRIADRPDDVEALTLLGLAYQQRARETADPGFYPQSERVLRQALRLEPANALTLRGLAALAASRHRFDESLVLARRAQHLTPRSAAVYGLLGDAFLELGRYRRAFAAFDRMAALKPGAVAYARISYARELLGDTEGAVEAMTRAVLAAGGKGEPAAWASTQLGNLFLHSGRLQAARASYRGALSLVPTYAPALAGLGRAHWWQGRLHRAARFFQLAIDNGAVPEYAVALGDVAAQLGQAGSAAAAYARASDLERAFAEGGGRNQLETALFDLDHDRNVADALRRARGGQRLRPSIEGEHVLAWALYKNGRCKAAKQHSIRALRLGTKDTGAMLHRSYIERCLGNPDAARSFRTMALEANPYALFTVGSPRMHGK
jgi:tetratricopeptide (TPR) repeat protein